MNIGYARSKEEAQRLLDGGCQQVEQDLTAALRRLQPDYVLVVTSVLVFDLPLIDILKLLQEILRKKRAGLRSLDDKIDTTGPFRMYTADLLSVLLQADAVRRYNRKRIGARAARGKQTGPSKHVNIDTFRLAQELVERNEITVVDACSILSIERTTYYRWARRLQKLAASVDN